MFIQKLRDNPHQSESDLPFFTEIEDVRSKTSYKSKKKSSRNKPDDSQMSSAELVARYYEHVGVIPSKA